ncbi:MAG: hypothetical protein ABIY50_12045 [Ignavibacteria bacterium]
MRHVIRVFFPLIAIIVFIKFYFVSSDDIKPIDNYPIWMKDSSGKRTDQTSGLFYVGMNLGKKIFISCDDIGKINRLSVDEKVNPPVIEITEIFFSEQLNILFQKFKKRDMEDIFYDSLNNKILLSIEGHEYSSYDPEIYRQKEGIYEITFNKDILTFDSLLTIKRLKLPKEVYAHTFDNISFEGFSATENYFFLGLENFQVKGTEFSDSTILYILNRKTNELKTIGTKELQISTICGLYSVDDNNLYGIDRNRKNMFYIKFNDDFTVERSVVKKMDLSVPLHPDMNDIIGIAPEAITFDDEGNIYVATDPWKDIYKPDISEKKRMSAEELKNFYTFIPMLYKFKNQLK